MIEVKKGIFQDSLDEERLVVKLSKKFFQKEPIMEAIHEYSGQFFTEMKPLENGFVGVSFSKKNNIPFDKELIYNFSNRVIDYQLRKDLERDYGSIRDAIVDYAYSPLKKKVIFKFKLLSNYGFFPFTFKRISEEEMLLVNIAGEHFFIFTNEFSDLISYKLDIKSEIFKTLKSKFFVFNNNLEINSGIELLANQIRSKQRYLLDFTSLHMVEITNYCNLSCDYCHASAVSAEEKNLKNHAKLRKNIIDKTIEKIFQTPSSSIKIELQGGEPLVNWETSKYLIENSYAKGLEFKDKKVEIILCTNLILIDEDKLQFLKKYNVHISTSLDGTKELHDKHRTTHNGKGTYDTFIENLKLTRKVLGHDSTGALLTVSKSNLPYLKEVIDEYIRLGFDGVFIRALNPYGMATKNLDTLGYPVEEFVDKYKKVLDYIIELNLKGIFFMDYYTVLLIKRILTPFSTGFMDLQSPAGAGISGVIYDFNGDVYPTDESRMLARTGNDMFKIGNVVDNSYEEIFQNKILIDITRKSILQTTPSCSNCVYNMYCGSDPVRNYVESGNIVGYKPDSDFCKKNMLLIEYLLGIIKENNSDVMNVFWSWITKRNLGDIRV